jgi:hypothetical protein
MRPNLVPCQNSYPNPSWSNSDIPNAHIPSTTIVLSAAVPGATINSPKAYYHHLKHRTFLPITYLSLWKPCQTISTTSAPITTMQSIYHQIHHQFSLSGHPLYVLHYSSPTNILAHSWILDQPDKDIHWVQ